MKRILVTGTKGYVGSSFQKWMSYFPDEYQVDMLSVRNDDWKKADFSAYDVVFHAAAIVHVKEENVAKYYSVNRDLTIELALKAKAEGVKQFIFLSTMAVFGEASECINENTILDPHTNYGKSKYEAEQFLLKEISNDLFHVAILRPPMVYGENCPGNYSRLAALARRVPIFPRVNNERSMIYIDNLTEFIKLIIDYEANGVFFPQNKEYVNTTDMVMKIADIHNKKLLILPFPSWVTVAVAKKSSIFRKVFGTLKYSKDMNGSPNTFIGDNILNYEVVDFEQSIILTEGRQM